jgi:NAD(P)H-flavin reductase
MSLSTFRQKFYEIFLASHVLLQAGGLAFLWFHYNTSMPYVGLSIAVVATDRLVFRLMLKSTHINADLQILEDGETVMISANWDIKKRQIALGHRNILHGWEPAQHAFITAPILSKSALLQAHPFTIASAAPDLTAALPHAWFSLLIRAHNGFSEQLLQHALKHSSINLRVDGPYGSPKPLHLLQDADHAILVAGGSGIAVVFPLAWALLHPSGSQGLILQSPRVSLIWIIHSGSHASWIPAEHIEELREKGLNLIITPPTVTYGRPDVGALAQELAYKTVGLSHDEERIGVVVSGPDALNRDVRNTCSRLVKQGLNVKVTVEKFGW